MNPYKLIRTNSKLSQPELGQRFDISRATIVALETGQLPKPSAYLSSSYVKLAQDLEVPDTEHLRNVDSLNSEYTKWQRVHRRKHLEQLRDGYDFWELTTNDSLEFSPFEDFCRLVSGTRTGFAKDFCLPEAALYRYARGAALDMPGAVWTVLRTLGLTAVELTELASRQQVWRIKCGFQ